MISSLVPLYESLTYESTPSQFEPEGMVPSADGSFVFPLLFLALDLPELTLYFSSLPSILRAGSMIINDSIQNDQV